MADTKVSALSSFTPVASDILYGVDDPGGTPVSGKFAISALATLLHATPTFTGLSTMTVGAANTGVLASTGYSLTGSNATSMIDLAGTWNTSGNPVALKIAITNTASGSTSKFASFLAGAGGVTEVAYVDKSGKVASTINGTPAIGIDVSGQPFVGIGRNTTVGGLDLYGNSTARVNLTDFVLVFDDDLNVGFATSVTQTIDTMFRRRAAASLNLGSADAASPVAQTLGVQSVVAGTSNTAGAAWTLRGSVSTGTGIGGSIVFQTTSAAASASTQNSLANVLELTGNKNVVVGNAALATDASDGFLYIPTCAGTPTGTPTAYTGRVALVYDTTNDELMVYDGAWIGEVLT